MVIRIIGDHDKYVLCFRCGINMGLFYDSDRMFCRDCLCPDLIGVFRMKDYSWLFESETA